MEDGAPVGAPDLLPIGARPEPRYEVGQITIITPTIAMNAPHARQNHVGPARSDPPRPARRVRSVVAAPRQSTQRTVPTAIANRPTSRSITLRISAARSGRMT